MVNKISESRAADMGRPIADRVLQKQMPEGRRESHPDEQRRLDSRFRGNDKQFVILRNGEMVEFTRRSYIRGFLKAHRVLLLSLYRHRDPDQEGQRLKLPPLEYAS